MADRRGGRRLAQLPHSPCQARLPGYARLYKRRLEWAEGVGVGPPTLPVCLLSPAVTTRSCGGRPASRHGSPGIRSDGRGHTTASLARMASSSSGPGLYLTMGRDDYSSDLPHYVEYQLLLITATDVSPSQRLASTTGYASTDT